MSDNENEVETESLIPDYIELEQCEQDTIDALDDHCNTHEFACDLKSIIEKLVAHIDKQNNSLSELAVQLAMKS